MQRVHLGKTRAGEPGIFTSNLLVLPLTPEQYKDYTENREHFAEYCKRQGFCPGDSTVQMLQDASTEIDKIFNL